MAHTHRDRLWERAAPALRVAGAILLAAGSILLYAERVVFDARAFGAHAALSLRDPRVAGYVAERIADEVIAEERDLTAYRPLLVGSARAIVSSDAFGAGFRRAAQEVHAVVFSESAERLALSLPDVGVLVRSALTQADPAVVARIPSDLRAGIAIETGSRVGRALLTLARLGHRFRSNAYLAIGLGGLLLFLGVFMPRDRRGALLRGGAALASVALVVFFLPPLAGNALTFSIADGARPVVAGIWDAFAGGLRLWALVLAGIGIVLAAAASSLASHVEVEEIARKGWARLRQPARSRRGEIARAATLMGVGLFAAFRPTATLHGLTVIAGALLAFEGLRELFMLVAPRIEEAARHAEEALAEAREQVDDRSAVRTWIRHALVGLLALALIAGGILLLRSPAGLPGTPVFTDACNGDRSLCDRRLDEVAFAGAHNSMSAAEFADWMFPNQELGSVSLLGHGIRALLFDVHYGMPIGGRVKTNIQDDGASRAKFEQAVGKEGVDAAMRIRDRLTGPPTGPRAPYLCHGFCELGAYPLVPMLQGVRDFLVQNPGEVLVFVIEDYVTPEDIAAAFRESGLERFVYRGDVKPPWPTLREMIDSGQRLLVLGENDAHGVPWYHPAFEVVQETPYTFLAPADFSCRANRGGTASPLFQINHWIETTPAPMPSNAEVVNARDFLLARARQCQQERGKLPNILAVDFSMTGSVVDVAAALNGLEGAADPLDAGRHRSSGAGPALQPSAALVAAPAPPRSISARRRAQALEPRRGWRRLLPCDLTERRFSMARARPPRCDRRSPNVDRPLLAIDEAHCISEGGGTTSGPSTWPSAGSSRSERHRSCGAS